MLFSGSSEDLLTPFKDVLMGLEGNDVTLSCNYSGSVQYLFLYRQNSGSSPQLVIGGLLDEKGEKFSLKHKKAEKQVDLVISSAAVTDSAVYYCALQPTVTGNTKTVQKPLEQRQYNTPQHPLEGLTHCSSCFLQHS